MRASSGSNIYEYTDQRNAFSQNTLKIEPCTDHNLVRTWDATADNELHLQSSCTYCGISNDYSCTLDELKKGKITITATGTPAQPTVTINVTPDANYILGNISYTANSAKSFVTADSLGAYVFNMPMANTVVNASFVPDLSYYKAYVNVTNNGTTNKVEATAKYLDIDNHIISIGDGTGVAIDKTTAGDLEVPETVTIDGIPFTVSEIGINAFNACASLTSASIPASVTALRTNAFCDASGLTKVTFGANSRLKTMEQGAFARNYKLAAFNMPDSVETIGPSCFASDTALHIAINLPEIESIGQSAFQSSGITSVSLGDSLKAMGNQTFFQCASLESVSFSKNCALESLLWRTFADDTKLKSVTLPGNLKEIGQTCFRNCAFTSLELPSTLTTLVAYGFQACKNLLSLDFSGTQLSAIGNKAFEGSTNLRYVDLRNTKVNVTAVNRGRNEFNGIGSQVIIYLPAGNTVTGDNIVNTSEDGTLSAASITVNGTTYNTDKVKKGAATWALNKFYGTQVFGQTIDTQGAPVPSTDASSFVYKADFRYNGIVRATKYANTGTKVTLPSDEELGATCLGYRPDKNMSAIQNDIVVEVTLAAGSTKEDVVLDDDTITDKDIVKIVPQNGGSSITVTFDDASTATASTASVGLAYVATLGSTTKTTNDNAKQLSVYGDRTVTARLDRTLYSVQWSSLSLPFSLSTEQVTEIFGEGTRLAVFDKQSSTTELNFTTTDSIEAGVPYLIWPAKNIYDIFVQDVVLKNITTGAVDSDTNWKFHANVGSSYTQDGSSNVKYFAMDNKLKTLTTNGVIAPMRAYLTYTAPAGAKVVRFTIDGTTTGIANIQADGEVTISHKGVYSLSGQYLGESTDSLPKGVYIVNGKKIIKK